MKKLVLAVSLITGAACGVDSQQSSAESASTPAVSSQSQALCTCGRLPPPPAIPAQPTEFLTYYRLQGRVIPLGVASAYTVTWQDPRDPSSFISLGYDVVNAKNLFYLHGSLARDYPTFTSLFAAESTAGTNPKSWIDNGSQGQVHEPIPPLPPGGIGELAWNAVGTNYSANH